MSWIRATTVADLLGRSAERWPDAAIAFPHERDTYAGLERRARRFARRLAGLGVEVGDTVGILMPPGLDFLGAYFGIAKLGALVVPINDRFKAHELGHVIGNADLRVLLCSDAAPHMAGHPALVAETLPGLADHAGGPLGLDAAPALRHVVMLSDTRAPGFLGRADLEAAGERVEDAEVSRRQERVRVRDVAVIMYTSGTTSDPKGCLLAHESLTRHAYNIAENRFAFTPAESFWIPLPLYHVGGVPMLLAAMAGGAACCHAGQFDRDTALTQLERERCTVAFPAFETIWLAVLDHPRFPEADLSALRLVINVGVPERLRDMQERVPWAVQVSCTGATESCSYLCLGMPDDPLQARLTTSGHPLPGMEVRIVDPETGVDRPDGERGELRYRGYARFEGYHKAPELTAEAIDADGWFKSGDLAVRDADGRIAYVGRLKDMLKVGGENVAAAEVEGFLARHPAVGIVQVVGAPDARYTEVACAFVQLKPGARADERELMEFCLGRIATFKVARYVRFVTEWPMSGTKIKKHVLRDRIAAELHERGITEAPRLRSPAPAARSS